MKICGERRRGRKSEAPLHILWQVAMPKLYTFDTRGEATWCTFGLPICTTGVACTAFPVIKQLPPCLHQCWPVIDFFS
jgi:hypothetical protein